MTNLTGSFPPPRRDTNAVGGGAASGNVPARGAMPPEPRSGVDEVERLLADARAQVQRTLDESMTRAETLFAQRWSALSDPMLAAIQHTVADFTGIFEEAGGARRRLVRFEALLQEPTPWIASADAGAPEALPAHAERHERPAVTPQVVGTEPAPAAVPAQEARPGLWSRLRPQPQLAAAPPPAPVGRATTAVTNDPLGRVVRQKWRGEPAAPARPATAIRSDRSGGRALPVATTLPRWQRGPVTGWAVAAGLAILIGVPTVYGSWRWRAASAGARRPLLVQHYRPYGAVLAEGLQTDSDVVLLTSERQAADTAQLPVEGEGGSTPALPVATVVGGPTTVPTTPETVTPTADVITVSGRETVRLGRDSAPLVVPAEPDRSEPDSRQAALTPAPVPKTGIVAEQPPTASPAAPTLVVEAPRETSVELPTRPEAAAATAVPEPASSISEAVAVTSQETEEPWLEAVRAPQPAAPAVSVNDREPPPVTPTTSSEARAAAPQPAPERPAARRGDLVSLTDAGVVPPVRTVEPRPAYPRTALAMRREATVELRVLVDENGRPLQIEPVGDRAGLGFDEAARRAVQDARWRPATRQGVPVKVWIRTTVSFRLRSE
ncbi:MAG: TonB family protein [Thermoanaerobaculia bacterium]